MINDGDASSNDQGKRKEEWHSFNEGARIISYNFNEEERPDGIKVRVKIRVESGRKGRARDARQAEALREYLTWVMQQPPPPTGEPEDPPRRPSP